MNRFSINFFAALFAFAIGSAVAIAFYQQRANHAPEFAAADEILKFEQSPAASEQERSTDEPICEDETVRLIWDTLKEDVLGRRKARPGANCADYLHAQLIADLNADGKKEILASRKEPCADGSCVNLWILQAQEFDKSKILIRETATSADVRKNRTKGFLDVKTGFRSRYADSVTYNLYRFDGEEYVLVKCWEEIHSVKEADGSLRKLKQPRILSLHCC